MPGRIGGCDACRLAAGNVPDGPVSLTLEWHRWLGLMAALAAVAALYDRHRHRPRRRPVYRIALFSAAAIVAVAGHFGAVLVWGADFLRP
jgi:hypothetical protein